MHFAVIHRNKIPSTEIPCYNTIDRVKYETTHKWPMPDKYVRSHPEQQATIKVATQITWSVEGTQ